MWQLTATGPRAEHRWQRTLPADACLVLGRQPRDADGWDVPWDTLISKEHIWLSAGANSLAMRMLPWVRNPVRLNGEPVTAADLSAGDTFHIGRTEFRVFQDD